MNLKNSTIVILGATKFDGIYESTSFTTAKFLARDNDVFYVDYPYTIRDYFREQGTKEYQVRKPHFGINSTSVIDTDIERLKIIVTPPVLSINFLPEGNFYRMMLSWNERLIAKKINKVLKSRSIQHFIFINSFNFHYPEIGRKINATLKVYQCVDPLIIDYDKRHGSVSEQILAKTSDVIVCTSKQLYKEKLLLNSNTFFVANAADLTHSSKALAEDLLVHESLSGIKKPIIGYFGHVERRMDFPLLDKVVKSNPDKSFVFVGPVSDEFVPSGFKDQNNVYFTGRLPYEDMPAVIKGFDVAIIPFKKDDVSKTIFPLKLFEYLGAGKPVVATDFNPDLAEFTREAVTYCNDDSQFTAAIKYYLEDDNKEAKQVRIAVAGENTWETRIAQLGDLLEKFYKQKLLS
ncbi:glycosyltransferase [Pedobacter frigoris]|uniref:glycosyltransferase family protein n=1 Tax=Pedobacter frigoris TaxID=2571272 RepID=UPI0029307F49|nr:glycosyltransferase [Pedobacter frigoris]